jgi:hypothetical protein
VAPDVWVGLGSDLDFSKGHAVSDVPLRKIEI